MNAPPDYYRILHVQPDAPAAIIHASYRTLLQRLQNVVGFGSDEDGARLAEAYAVLGDEQRRAAYDRQRRVDFTATGTYPRPADDSTTQRLRLNVCLFCGTPQEMQRTVERDDDCGHCTSPLFPAERHRLEYSGQRMLRRISKQRDVLLYVTWPQPEPFSGETRDLSLNGMQFVCDVRLQVNQIVKIECQELGALGRVAHSRSDHGEPERWITGIEFLTLRFRNQRGSFFSARA